jgi:hypothetical protein
MAKNQMVATAINIALIMTVIGASWLVLENGVGQTYDVVTGDNGNITSEVNASYGGSVGFADRVVTFGAVTTLLVGFGAVSISRSQPKVFNDILRYYPLLIGVIGMLEFSSIISDMVNGSYDFDVFSDGQNALNLFVAGSVIGAVANLLNARKN